MAVVTIPLTKLPKATRTQGSLAVPTYHATLSNNAHGRRHHIDPTASTASLAASTAISRPTTYESMTPTRHNGTENIETQVTMQYSTIPL